jgi:hypothetical protein
VEDAQQVVQMVRRIGKQAIEIARRVGDPGVLAFTLGVMRNVSWGRRRPRGALPMPPRCCSSPR